MHPFTTATTQVSTERRQERRYQSTSEVVASLPQGVDQEVGEPRMLLGTVVNLSVGGAAVVADQCVDRLTVLPFKFHFSNVPVPVPVLAQVRWVSAADPSMQKTFRLGLRFIY